MLTFHYRETPPELRPYLMEKARSLIIKYGFKPVEANCAIEAKPPVSWNKGKIFVIANVNDVCVNIISFDT